MAPPIDPLVRRLRDERFDRALHGSLLLGIACLCALAGLQALFDQNLAALLRAGDDCPEVRTLRARRPASTLETSFDLR